MYKPFDGYILDDDAKYAYDLIANGNPVTFITGSGGVGKSSLLKYIRYNTSKSVVVVCPTGVAALNAEGTTINSFFWFPPHILRESDVKFRKDEVIANLDMIIIDEASMVRADVMDMIDYALRKWKSTNKPFGGIQMVLVGDMFQLPPVVKSGSEKDIIDDRYPNGCYFYNADVFDRVKMVTVELKTVYRQSDEVFISMLNNIRKGIDIPKTLDDFNSLCHRKKSPKSIILTSTNAIKDKINNMMYDKIDTTEYVYSARTNGQITIDDRYPSPEQLCLKIGVRVMVTKNTLEGKVCNGNLGTVKLCNRDCVDVELDNGLVVQLREESWQFYKYKYDKNEKQVDVGVAGEYIQIPLVLAYAISIHKSQSLTFEAVHIDLGRGSFATGQLYTALSRCKNLDQLTFATPLTYKDVMVDADIKTFYTKALDDRNAKSFKVEDKSKNVGTFDGTKKRTRKVKDPNHWCKHIVKTESGWMFDKISADVFTMCPICGTKCPESVACNEK